MRTRAEAQPRYATEAAGRPHRGVACNKIARMLGQPLLPWQRLVAEIATEYDEQTGIPAYREVGFTVPRQNGKSILALTWILERGLLRPRPQRMVYTAQTGLDSRKKLLDEPNGWAPLLERTPLTAAIKQVRRDAGNPGITFRTGSRLGVQANTEESGHGDAIDLGVIDEAWADEDDRREQAVIPAMITRDDAQLLVTSTAGTQKSVYLRRKVEAGRRAAKAGDTTGVAYFEWGFPEGTVDLDDEDMWWESMPGLGHTISIDAVRHARKTMEDDEFDRAFGNRWTAVASRAIPAGSWQAVQDAKTAPEGQLVIGVDATPDSSSAALAVADEYGRVELVEHKAGIRWVAGRAKALAEKLEAVVVVDTLGPLSGLSGDHVAKLNTADACLYTAEVFERIIDGHLRVRPHPALDEAAEAATRRTVGDRWLWARKGDSDIAPLVAMTWAVGYATRPVELDDDDVMPLFEFA